MYVMRGLPSNSFTHEEMINIEMMSIYKSIALEPPIDHVHSTCDMTLSLLGEETCIIIVFYLHIFAFTHTSVTYQSSDAKTVAVVRLAFVFRVV